MNASSASSARNLVFVSYSHVDTRWLERLRVHLKPLERQGVLALWDDGKITPGTRWRDEIRNALDHARVAVLLVTADFLASDFIAANELPPLLKSAEDRGTLVLPIIVKPCRFEQTEGLSCFQAVNSPSTPLVAVRSARREEVFVKVSRLIEDAFRSAVPQVTPAIAHQTAGSARVVGSSDAREVEFGPYAIRELASGSIEVLRGGHEVKPTKPALRELASILNLGLLNRNGNPLNTRQLGALVIDRIRELGAPH
ncbi:MAG TPA: toll/interleukin-1 receptor domain-containing protein [Longimicrobium sp.]|jgi:hypothetical protein|uniref:toll/interleukin-1 receptor domain-containing protein n=1 Tax=Longimicrobium sp. TaxID=2029185 RepID=UPI002EDA710C